MGPRSRWIACLCAGAFVLSSLAGCGDDPSSSPDVTPPNRVTDLRAVQQSATTGRLRWTAPGDDEDVGRAAAYDVRRARYVITASNWATTDVLPGLGAPRPAGQPESLLVSGLTEGVEFHFALRSTDDAGNASRISNLPSLTIDVTAPAAVDSLAVALTDRTSIRLKWKATGDDGTTGVARAYDLRYATVPLTEASWPQATRVLGTPTPLPSGQMQFFLVQELQPATDYWFALKAIDEAGNGSPLSGVVQGRTHD